MNDDYLDVATVVSVLVGENLVTKMARLHPIRLL